MKTNIIYIIRNLISLLLSLIIFMVSVHQMHLRAWLLYGAAIFISIAGNILIMQKNPELLGQRSKIGKGTKSWDKWWLISYIVFFAYGMPLVAGLDIRFHGYNENIWLALTGVLFYFISMIMVLWSMSINRHFEGTVRIQKERNHTVVSDGPYQFVRHPGYLGVICWGFGFPLAIGSNLALIVGILLVPFIMLRTFLEDNTLQNELTGYREYSQRTRFRLFPGIW